MIQTRYQTRPQLVLMMVSLGLHQAIIWINAGIFHSTKYVWIWFAISVNFEEIETIWYKIKAGKLGIVNNENVCQYFAKLQDYRRDLWAFIFYMFWWSTEALSWLNDNALISGFRGSSHLDLRCHDFKISRFVKLLTPRKIHILLCMDSKFCVKFQRAPLKFHIKVWIHTPQNMHLARW